MKWKEDFPSKQYPFFPLPVWDRVRNGIGNLKWKIVTLAFCESIENSIYDF